MKISVITITYNSEKTLEETINSIISQEYEDFEYIIIDGASTDNTMNIVQKYQDKITKIVSEPDKGICDAFNKGIAQAEGELIAIINSDDILLPGALDIVARTYDESVDVIYGDGLRLFPDGTMKPYKCKELRKIKMEMPLMHPSTFVSRKAYDKYGVFDMEYNVCMDRELLLRMYSKGAKFKYIPYELSVFRMGGLSDVMFSTKVKMEREQISLKYGAKKWQVKLFMFNSFLKMKIKGLFE